MQRAAGFHRAVGKPVEFLQRKFSGVERAEHEASAVGSEIAGEIMCGSAALSTGIMLGEQATDPRHQPWTTGPSPGMHPS